MKRKVIVKCIICQTEFVRLARNDTERKLITSGLKKGVKIQRAKAADTCKPECSKTLRRIIENIKTKRLDKKRRKESEAKDSS